MIKRISLLMLIFTFGIGCDKPIPAPGNKKNVDLKRKKRKESILKFIEEGNIKAIETQKLFIETNENLKQLQEFKQSKESDQDRLIILFTVPEDLFKILLKVKESAGESVKTSSQLLKLITKAQGIKECISQGKLALKQSKFLFSKVQQAEKLLAVFLLTFQKTYGYIDTVQLFPLELDLQKNTLNLPLTQNDPGPDSHSNYVQDNKVSLSNKDIIYELTTSSLPSKNVRKSGNLLIKTLDALLVYAKEDSEFPLITILSKNTTELTDSVVNKDTNTIELTDAGGNKDTNTTELADSQIKKNKLTELADSQIEVEDSLELVEPQVDSKDSLELSEP